MGLLKRFYAQAASCGQRNPMIHRELGKFSTITQKRRIKLIEKL